MNYSKYLTNSIVEQIFPQNYEFANPVYIHLDNIELYICIKIQRKIELSIDFWETLEIKNIQEISKIYVEKHIDKYKFYEPVLILTPNQEVGLKLLMIDLEKYENNLKKIENHEEQ